ncbi:DMT family transporter [Chromobacterium piscinae]|uniref:DMT family transporter n=1 Tax=Chromobacterium piscinae TaxID=686831 RepID=A0ABV0GZS6_9NEIS|nr:DMT family transporter [Chromobacterium piscinae]MCD4505901.1 DMT family transporter [Chromobacterium piscinae]
MLFFMTLAIANGLCIGGSRSLNGKLAQHDGALAASFWNHLGGFLFLSLLLAGGAATLRLPLDAPLTAWCGGVIGALFVALNGFALPRLGTMKTALLVIAGQMLSGVLIDRLAGNGGKSAQAQLAGIGLIALGLYLSKRGPAKPAAEVSASS